MNLHDANRALDGYLDSEGGMSPIQFGERRATCRECGQRAHRPTYAHETPETPADFWKALAVAVLCVAAWIVLAYTVAAYFPMPRV